MGKPSDTDKKLIHMAQVKEYKKLIDSMEKVAARETHNPEGMIIFLGEILGMMCDADLIDPNRFWRNQSKGKRATWDVDTCNVLAKTLPAGAQEMYSNIVRILTKEEKENRKISNTNSKNSKVEHEVMCVIARDALRSVMENEVEVVEKYLTENAERQKSMRRILTTCRKSRNLCKCLNRCVESYFGECIMETPNHTWNFLNEADSNKPNDGSKAKKVKNGGFDFSHKQQTTNGAGPANEAVKDCGDDDITDDDIIGFLISSALFR